MRWLSLFTGAGGGELAMQGLLGHRTVGYVEWDDYCQEVLSCRIKDGLLDEAPIFGDIKAFIRNGYADRYRGMVDGISGGFPCQPFSVAGRGKASDDSRNMWPSTFDCIRIVRPRYAFLENVPGLLSRKHRYFETILEDLASCGYDVRWKVISAGELGAPHKRDRLWILAYTSVCGPSAWGNGAVRSSVEEPSGQDASDLCEVLSHTESEYARQLNEQSRGKRARQISKKEWFGFWDKPCRLCEDVSDTQGTGLEGHAGDGAGSCEPRRLETGQNGRFGNEGVCDPAESGLSDGPTEAMGEPCEVAQPERPSWWTSEPDVGRVANGVASRVDRLKAIGNGQVPIVAAAAWNILTEGLIDAD